MITEEEFSNTEEFWLKTIQHEISLQVSAYLKENKLTQTQFSTQLGVSKGYISQMMKGEFNFTLKKLIELSLAIGKAPVLRLEPLTGLLPENIESVYSSHDFTFSKAAEPEDQAIYFRIGKSGNYFVDDIKGILAFARTKAYSAVNAAMVEAYWLIGKRIVEEEQQGFAKAAYGEKLLQALSKELSSEMGNGFSYANLRNFRQFYLTYSDSSICYTLCSRLTWSHNRLIMRVEDESARLYYLNEAFGQNWSVRQLERNIHTFYFHRVLSSQIKTGEVQFSPVPEKVKANDFIKDPYVFEFLNIPEPLMASEGDIESALIRNLQKFLLELGKGFSFVGRQFRISTETQHFYIDLVFYNYMLKSFVLFDLKTTKLSHQDTGQMDMYIRMFDDLKKQADDNPTIGIILCAEKDETVVKYSILKDHKQLFATKYLPFLPTEAELIAEIDRGRLMLEDKIKNDN